MYSTYFLVSSKVVIPTLYRAPEFAPEPPVFDSEDDCILAPETPFEVYIYLKAFRSRTNLAEYLAYFGQFVDSYPAFANPNNDPADDTDVRPPGVDVSIPWWRSTWLRPTFGWPGGGPSCAMSPTWSSTRPTPRILAG